MVNGYIGMGVHRVNQRDRERLMTPYTMAAKHMFDAGKYDAPVNSSQKRRKK